MHLHILGILFRKIDVKNAYINENMRRIVFTKCPPGYTFHFHTEGEWSFRRLKPGEKAPPDMALPLHTTLYGGMECGRIFWEAWVGWHLSNGFQIIHEERCYLSKRDDKGNFIKLGFHVDDNVVIALGLGYYQEYLNLLTTRFDITEGPLEDHLGIFYEYDRALARMTMTQSAQTVKMLKIFGMENCKPESAPTMGGPALCTADCEDPPEEKWDMEGFIGHALWIYMCTRPDIGQALKVLSRFTKKFGKRHVEACKHLLRYLKGTVNLGLIYQAGFPLFYQVFTDASHANCPDTRRSILSIAVKMGGMLVYWKNSFSSIVSHSSTESELFALDLGATIGQCLRWLSQSMGGPIQGKVQIFVDNQGTITIASNPIQAGRNLHVHARYFYVRDLVYDDQFVLTQLPTDKQIADVGCTFKGGPSFRRLRDWLMATARVVNDEHDIPQWQLISDIQ